jgi:hypothetical protein
MYIITLFLSMLLPHNYWTKQHCGSIALRSDYSLMHAEPLQFIGVCVHMYFARTACRSFVPIGPDLEAGPAPKISFKGDSRQLRRWRCNNRSGSEPSFLLRCSSSWQRAAPKPRHSSHLPYACVVSHPPPRFTCLDWLYITVIEQSSYPTHTHLAELGHCIYFPLHWYPLPIHIY